MFLPLEEGYFFRRCWFDIVVFFDSSDAAKIDCSRPLVIDKRMNVLIAHAVSQQGFHHALFFVSESSWSFHAPPVVNQRPRGTPEAPPPARRGLREHRLASVRPVRSQRSSATA